MARKKTYIEEEVIEKAMNLFWRNGYETTSMQMLEKEMGINKFSIYASFGNKNGVFIECLKCYKLKLNQIIKNLKASSGGTDGIKQYFYDFINFSKETGVNKGCLITNTANEIGEGADENVKEILSRFTNEVKQAFADSLQQDKTKSIELIEQQADYLIIAMFGLSSATRVFNKTQLDNYIENIFKNI
ncbi:TetR/AcrR family transcriptional regulator [Flavobacterium arcticum]|uniref:TetR/AcrR family transcriptional regulator n=1 Tax=Flavobacterium arcticum TaxID=1784713 RepID=A0A345HBV5_9FLAO|nr:TetR/AcrR family transcriptional regulator [Flavobacterium arcticum]AXG74065.1 TetR/AcrR family transcriptional regulator [Flavobacterium arcticum]KAF2507374.1 TetR/AcrR family transcriptional regulator [Flavobacterium arcticum]